MPTAIMKNRIPKIIREAFWETGASLLFSRKGALTHHHVVASFISLAPPQATGLTHSAAPPFPHKAGFAGAPCWRWYSSLRSDSCALHEASAGRFSRGAGNASVPDGTCHHCLCGWQSASAAFALPSQIRCSCSVQPAIRLRKPAAVLHMPFEHGRVIASLDDAADTTLDKSIPASSIFFCIRQKKQQRLPAGQRKEVISYGNLSPGSQGRKPR